MPAPIPVTIPEAEPTVATPYIPLLHIPPGVTSLKLWVAPTQIPVAPVTIAGTDLL